MLEKKHFLFSYNRFGVISFWDEDHGGKKDEPLHFWVKSKLKESNITDQINRITVLCYPRIFGYVFNPISVYFCYDKNNHLCAILYEVSNTFHETHTYVFKVKKEEHEQRMLVYERKIRRYYKKNIILRIHIQANKMQKRILRTNKIAEKNAKKEAMQHAKMKKLITKNAKHAAKRARMIAKTK